MAIENLTTLSLSNGLPVLLKESHVAPVASFWIFYRVGSRNELPGTTGISHWVEHMLFKGTERFPRGEFDKAVARAGGMANGMTTQDCTTYFETLPTERIDLALEFEADRMVNTEIDADEVEAERSVIISEREGSENSYFYLLSEEVQAAAFRVHSYHNPVIGWKTDLLQITRDDLQRHYERYYAPNNAVIVMVGDFDTQEMTAKLEAHFGNLPVGPQIPPVRLHEPEQIAERRVILRGSDHTAYYLHSFPGVAANHPDFFAMTVLDAILGGAKGMGLFGGGGNNRSNRLYRALVDTELAVGVGSAFRPSIDPDLFSFYATLAPGVTHEQIEDVVWQEIKKIQQHGVQPSELEKAIKQTKAQFAYSSESVTHQGFWLGFSQMVASLSWLDQWLEQLSAVTVEDVQRVATTYFTPNRQTVGWYIPDEDGES
jgi:zinc protease